MWYRFRRWLSRLFFGKKQRPWRRGLKHFYHEFDKPAENKRGKQVVSKLGKLYYRRSFPSWVMWNFETPNSLWVNVPMLSEILVKELGLRQRDALIDEVAFKFGEDLLRTSTTPRLAPSVQIKPHINTASAFSVNNWINKEKRVNIEAI